MKCYFTLLIFNTFNLYATIHVLKEETYKFDYRGSSSGNFFNNRNGGKEDPDDDYVAASQAREQELIKGGKKKNKNQVRKLLTGKRPVSTTAPTAAPTAAPTTAPTVAYYNRYNTVQRGRPSASPTTTTENYPSTAVPSDFTRQRYNQQQEDFQRFRGNQNFAFNKKPIVTSTEFVQDTTTTAPAYNFQGRGNNYYQQPQSTAAPAFNNYYQTQPSSTVAPVNYKTNFNQGNNYYQAQTTTAAPQTNYNQGTNNNNYYQTQTTQSPQYNYNQQTSTPASTIYNAYNRGSSQTTSTNNNANYNQNTNYQNNYQQNPTNYQNYNSPSTVNTNANYDATTLKQNYFQKQTTVNYDNYYKTSTSAPVAGYSTTLAPNYNYDDSANIFQQTKNQYNLNTNAAGTTYNPYNSYKGSNNDGYDEPSVGESLKTAPSSNIRPSDLNAIAKSYQKPAPAGFNASLTASYNFANPATTQKPTSKYYSSPKQFQTTVKPVQQPSSRGNNFYAQSTTTSPQPRPFSKVPENANPPKTVTKEKDASYDYAYYDEATGSEYDGIDTIGEEFHRTTHKHGRTTPQ